MSNDVNQDSTEDKRRHPRFPLRAYAELQYSTKTWEAHVLDLSENGARLALLDEHLLQKGDALRVHVDVENLNLVASNKKRLDLHGRIAHVREHILGFEFQPDTPVDKTLLYELLMLVENQ
uniref:PilZ domain-containing protein n=1 Tax=Cellvibrio fontiphilus TaxID=1815559 RepID=UPI002B4C14F6|nr:PilZ domain-containing protein [Cellvibrio fontiphilus]